MSTKHLFDSADGLVLRSLRGAVALNPSLRLHASSKSVYVGTQSQSTRVAIISGGGAGHEPAHAGYTGRGMLAASISGDIFASPTAKQILRTINLVASDDNDPNPSGPNVGTFNTKRDILVIINNYTGDRLNFGLAIEKALASFPKGVRIESVVVADDVSLLRTSYHNMSLVGPRGLAGNILVCKIIGALAERGESLACLKELGDAVVGNLASIGVGLDHCHVPGRALPEQGDMHRIREREYEVGLGLHNEPGAVKKETEGPRVLVAEMLELILTSRDTDSDIEPSSPFLRTKTTLNGEWEGDDVVLFVNNLGGVSQLEMGAILDEIVIQLDELGIHPIRIYLSSYMTSLNAPGFSISILNESGVQRTMANQRGEATAAGRRIKITELLDDPTDALAWIGVRSHWPDRGTRRIRSSADDVEHLLPSPRPTPPDGQDPAVVRNGDRNWWARADISPKVVERGIITACRSVLGVEKEMTEFDTAVGDGDCGETFSAGANAILVRIHSGDIAVAELDPDALVRQLGETLEDSMGGTIGALFAIFFAALSSSLRGIQSWPVALHEALTTLNRYTPAKPGDRTLVDSLAPFCSQLVAGKTLEDATTAAKAGAYSTKKMRPMLGRATYMAGNWNEDDLPPDPGAWGVAALLEGLCDGLHPGE